MWANFAGYELALDEDSRRRLGAAAGATTLCAVLLLVIAVVHYSFGRRGSRVGATLLTLTLLASVGFPADGARLGRAAAAGGARDRSVAAGRRRARGRTRDPARRRRRLARLHRAARRRRPAAGVRTPARGRRLALSRDACGRRSRRPVWTAVGDRQVSAADRRPRRGPLRVRVRPRADRAAARPTASRRRSSTSACCARSRYQSTALRARPLWTILSSQRVSAGVVGWPVTAPARAAARLPDHRRVRPGSRPSPPEVDGDELGCAGRRRAARASRSAGGPLGVARRHRSRSRRWRATRGAARSPCSCATSTGRGCWPSATKASIAPGISTCGTRGRAPSAASVQDGEARLAAMLDRHYAFLDAEIAQRWSTLGPDDVLLVVSGFGMEPVGLGKRLLARAARPAGRAGLARGRARRLPAGLRRADAIGPRAPGIDRRRRARPSSTCSACPSPATWTASPAPTSSSRRSPPPVRSPSSRPTSDERVAPVVQRRPKQSVGAGIGGADG